MMNYFIIISPLILFSSLMVVFSRSPITSVLYLILVYILTSICFLFLGAEFLSILIIIIYVGAISILFLFVIMMLNLRIVEVYNSLAMKFPVIILISLLFILEIIVYIYYDLYKYSMNHMLNDSLDVKLITYDLIDSYNNLYLLGDLLYNVYSHYLVVIALLLLLAMIGSTTLTLDLNYHYYKSKKNIFFTNTKHQKGRITFWGLKNYKKFFGK